MIERLAPLDCIWLRRIVLLPMLPERENGTSTVILSKDAHSRGRGGKERLGAVATNKETLAK